MTEFAKCYYCKKPLTNKWGAWLCEVYAISGAEGEFAAACEDCYREKVNPIITQDDFDEEIKNIEANAGKDGG